MVYICQAPDVRGKFDVKKAQALGVPNGPSRGMLVKGMDIEVDDPNVEGGRRTIKPEDCLVGGGPGAVSCLRTTSADD
jgi:ribonuclease Z